MVDSADFFLLICCVFDFTFLMIDAIISQSYKLSASEIFKGKHLTPADIFLGVKIIVAESSVFLLLSFLQMLPLPHMTEMLKSYCRKGPLKN